MLSANVGNFITMWDLNLCNRFEFYICVNGEIELTMADDLILPTVCD